jgi:hypothetical protein
MKYLISLLLAGGLATTAAAQGLLMQLASNVPVAGGAPTLSSAVIDKSGTEATLTFSESVTIGAGGNGGVALTLNSGSTTATYLSGSGSTALIYSLWAPVLPAATVVTVAYTQPGNGIEATTGGADVATFSGSATTNASTVLAWFDMEGNSSYGGSGESWTENIATDGVINEDYTSTVLSGSQSLFLDEGTGGDIETYVDLGTGYASIALRCMFRQVTNPGANTTNQVALQMRDSSATARATAQYDYTHSGTTNSIYARIATTNGTPASDTFQPAQTIYLWLDYSNTTDVVNMRWNTTLEKPADASSKHSSATVASTATIQRISFRELHVTQQIVTDNLVAWVP